MKLYEQVDVTNGKPTYSWILDAPYKFRKHLPEWKWVRGRPGCFVTNDKAAAYQLAVQWKLSVTSNGSHKVHGMPLSHEEV